MVAGCQITRMESLGHLNGLTGCICLILDRVSIVLPAGSYVPQGFDAPSS